MLATPVGNISVNVQEVVKLYHEKYAKAEQERWAGPEWVPRNYYFSGLHKCIREQSYPMQGYRPDAAQLARPTNPAGQMSLALGIKVHEAVQAALVAAGVCGKSDTEVRLDITTIGASVWAEMKDLRIGGKPDAVVKLPYTVFEQPDNIRRMQMLDETGLKAAYAGNVKSSIVPLQLPVELKTWNYDKLHAQRGNRWGNEDDRDYVRKFYGQLQQALHWLDKPFGLIYTVNVHHDAAMLVEVTATGGALPTTLEYDTVNDVREWVVAYDAEFVLREQLERLETANKWVLELNDLPPGEPERGNGFCQYVSQCADAARKCGKR